LTEDQGIVVTSLTSFHPPGEMRWIRVSRKESVSRVVDLEGVESRFKIVDWPPFEVSRLGPG